jgi:hypothetical protein
MKIRDKTADTISIVSQVYPETPEMQASTKAKGMGEAKEQTPNLFYPHPYHYHTHIPTLLLFHC